jgi:hypothetical protein
LVRRVLPHEEALDIVVDLDKAKIVFEKMRQLPVARIVVKKKGEARLPVRLCDFTKNI